MECNNLKELEYIINQLRNSLKNWELDEEMCYIEINNTNVVIVFDEKYEYLYKDVKNYRFHLDKLNVIVELRKGSVEDV